MKNAITAGIIFGLFMGLYSGITGGLFSGIFSFVISGGMFALFIGMFTRFQTKKFGKIEPDAVNGEEVIKSGAANHFLGMEAVGGWLYLTANELIFVSHKINIQRHRFTLSLKEISSIDTRNTLGIIPNGLLVKLEEGVEHKFVVNGRADWVATITKARSQNIA